MSNPSFTIVIPTKNRSHSLNFTLESLTKQKFRDFEIIIVDESTDDRTRNLCKRYKRILEIRYYSAKLGSLPRARNLGVEKAKGSIIVFMDDDVIVPSTFLSELKKIFDAEKNVVGIQGLVISKRMYYPPIKNALKRALLLACIYGNKNIVRRSGQGVRGWVHNIKKEIEVQWFEGCCFAVRREVFKYLLFDKKMILWACGEDIDFTHRLYDLKIGKLVVTPRIKVYHLVDPSSRLQTKQKYYMFLCYWAYRFFKTSRNSLLNILAFLFAFLVGDSVIRILNFLLNPSKKELELLHISFKAKKDVLWYLHEIIRGNLNYHNRVILTLK